jgi:hypothetical protein
MLKSLEKLYVFMMIFIFYLMYSQGFRGDHWDVTLNKYVKNDQLVKGETLKPMDYPTSEQRQVPECSTYKRCSKAIEDTDGFNSRRYKRLLTLFGLLGSGTTVTLLLNIFHYMYKLVIKNVNDLKSLERNSFEILRRGYWGTTGIVAYFMRILSLKICDIMGIKDTGFNSLRQEICFMIVRLLGIGPMASYLIFCLLDVCGVMTNHDGFKMVKKLFTIVNILKVCFGLPLTIAYIVLSAHRK